MSRLRTRTVWLKLHLYLALTLGAFIAVLGLTGSILVFNPQIDRWLGPAPHSAAPVLQPVSADVAIAAVEQRFQQRAALIRLPRAERPQYRVELYDPRVDDYRIVLVDAASGAILSSEIWGRTFITFLFELHTHLLMGEYGFALVGGLGIVLLVSIASGLYLWWPRGGAVRQAFTFKRSKRLLPLNFELHRITGAYLAAILLAVTVAGVYITLPEPLVALVKVFTHVSGEPEDVPSSPVPGARSPITLAKVQEVFRAHAPGARIASIGLPRNESGSYTVHYVDRGEPANYYGRSSLWIDQYTGRILSSHSYSELESADRFLALQLPIHSGEILGIAGRISVFLSGLALCLLYGTGLYLWWKRRRPATTSRPGA